MTALYQTKISEPESRDVVDRLPSRDRVTNLDIILFVISIISHLVDLIFDCNVARQYYMNGEIGYFLTTLAFILIPALINTAFSIRMYVLDNSNKNQSTTLTKKFTKRRLCFIIVLLFQLAPVLRYFEALRYALKSRKAEKNNDQENQRKYYELMIKEDSDVALLRVLECFQEAAPQQILQITIILYKQKDGILDSSDTFSLIHQLLSISSSFFSMAWSMASYHRLLRVSLMTKNNISRTGTFIQFMWHFCVTVSRILCISVIASIYPEYTILVLLIHWFVMTVWLSCATQKNDFCGNNKIYDFFLYLTYGTVYIFTHVSLVDGRTCCRYLFFYTVLFIENTIANVIWINHVNEALKNSIYYKPIIVLNIVPFIAGIIFMILYYKVFHPSTGYHKQQQII